MKRHFVWILSGLISITGCSSTRENVEPKNFERTFRASYEETWRAVQQSIISYPLKVNNMDNGQIQTTAVRGSSQFKPPHVLKANAGGHRYTLIINVLKDGPTRTKVSILKDMVLHRDFISKPEAQVSDGLEESVILYRIGREIEVEKSILKASKQKPETGG